MIAMFSRRRRPTAESRPRNPQELPTESDATLAGAGLLASQPFKVDPHLGYVVHEQSGYSILLQLNGILTVYGPNGLQADFDLRTMQLGQWAELYHYGHKLPVQVYLNGYEVVCRWVFPDDHPTDAGPNVTVQPYAATGTTRFWTPRSDAERRSDARLLDDLQRGRHGNALQQINSIR